jgi:hypothetical protein
MPGSADQFTLALPNTPASTPISSLTKAAENNKEE